MEFVVPAAAAACVCAIFRCQEAQAREAREKREAREVFSLAEEKLRAAAWRLEEERQATERALEEERQAGAQRLEQELQQERQAAARRLEEERLAAERALEEERRTAARRLEEERQAAARRLEEALQRERDRIHAEKLRQWRELNREYPIPEYLQPYVTGVSESPPSTVEQERFVNVGVLGNAGIGKSSLIKAMLEHFRSTEAGNELLPTTSFEGDGTQAPTLYTLQEFGEGVHLWDLPGQGTSRFPAKTYLRDMGLKYFDAVLVVTSGRLLENDLRLLEAIKFADIWVNVVRTKVDQAVEDGKADHNPPLSQEVVLQKVNETLAQQLDERDPTKIHLITVRKRYWDGEHGGAGFGTLDKLCSQLAERVTSKQALKR